MQIDSIVTTTFIARNARIFGRDRSAYPKRRGRVVLGPVRGDSGMASVNLRLGGLDLRFLLLGAVRGDQ
jgi:hypothetical protein